VKWWKRVLASNAPLIVLGRTGSGKTTAVLNLINELKFSIDVYILDLFGEYSVLDFPVMKPRLSFKAIRQYLPYVLSAALRPSSSGLEIAAAAEEAAVTAESWRDFIRNLEMLRASRRYYHGVQGILSRLLPIQETLCDENLPFPPPGVIDLSTLPRIDSKLIFQALFTAWFTIEATVKEFHKETFLIIEEATEQYLPSVTPIIMTSLRLLRKHRVKPILIYHTLPIQCEDILLEQCLLILPLGHLGEQYFFKYGFPGEVRDLKIGEALLYIPEEGKWRRIKIKPRILPKPKKSYIVSENNCSIILKARISSLENNNVIDIADSSVGKVDEKIESFEKRLRKIEEAVASIKITTPSVLEPRLRAIVSEVEKVKTRVAADEKSIERVLDFLEEFDKRMQLLERRLSRLERAIRKITEYLEYREQEASMRGEEL